MATIQKIKIPAKTPTPLVRGNGLRVWIQGGSFYLGGSDVDSGTGIFIKKRKNQFIDLGNVALGETIYVFSKRKTTLTIFYYTTVF
jgi:hypothetical protein